MRRLWLMLDEAPLPSRQGVFVWLTASAASFAAVIVTLVFDLKFGIQLPFLWAIAAILVVTVRTGMTGGLHCAAMNLLLQIGMAYRVPMTLLTFRNIAVVACLSACLAVIGGWRRQKRADRDAFAAQIKLREAHLQSIFDHLPAPIVIIDVAGRVRGINAAGCALFEVAPDTVFGGSLEAFVIRQDPDERSLADVLSDLSASGSDLAVKARGTTATGRALHLLLTASRVPSGEGRWLTVHVQDETERLAAAARLEDVQRQLMHVSRATALGELGSAIAHELNQPLAAISACLGAAKIEIARERIDRAEIADALDTSLAHTLRAGAVLKRLRVFVARAPETRQVITVADIVAEAVSLVQFAVRDAGVRLDVTVAPGLGAVEVDPVQIQQVLLNMIRNAIEAMRDAAVRMITIEARADGHAGIVISVVDTGTGIAPAIADLVFTPFETTKGDGLGVGLSISKTIVESFGGEIGCEANGGAGTRFWFSLPLARAEGSRLAA
ncbi:sensor histidine kinase [Sphingomonas sp. PAMC 26621]|uniref:sensor histidine kinase n=1 Tax=Sphingomonas sp. PAMC 26621 TaxID=1112213 RepID=UPI00028907F4|nr:ATP-binding protein [Sphingomonas sp. PAMC 26621]